MRNSTTLAIAIIVLTALVGSPARADNACKRPRALVVLDKSSSMITGTVGGSPKWDVAKSALSQVLTTYDEEVDFGLMLFPNPSQCGPGAVKVAIGPSNASAILAQLADPPPEGGNWTPMAQSLDVAAQVPELNDSDYVSHVLLITDGWQWCSPYDEATRFLPVNSVVDLTNLGIKTWVVGFGEAVDALTLNKMAEAAQTKAAAGCDPTSSDAQAPNNCYYQANDPAQLVAALQDVVSQISAEICDGDDNNCNGQIDEGLEGPLCVKQTGICTGARKACGGDTGWLHCTAADYDKHAAKSSAKYETSETICDGKDNDCDGTVDEGCSCTNGETRPCGNDTGECAKGTQTCVNGSWGSCSGEVMPSDEVCDNRDNNCSGQIDEGLTRECSTKCGPGTETCQAGKWTGCTAQEPSTEICDGLDNDCDLTVDGPSAVCDNGGVCIDGVCEPVGSGGCDCEVTAVGSTPLPLLTLALAGLLLVVSLRRRRRR